jgi:simple sugar transport system ATP-binding protein
LGSHSIAIQQLCAIARATSVNAKVLILDEPTSSLDQAEVDELFAVIRELKAQGVAILFVSHFLEQVYEISDRITVLRNGQFICEKMTADFPRMELISAMIGRSGEDLDVIADKAARQESAVSGQAQPLVKAVGLGKTGMIEPFDLDNYPGEIIGLAGLLGSGRSEVARLIYGADKPSTGSMDFEGKPIKNFSPLASLRRGVALSAEDRKRDGIIGELTVRENIALAIQARRGILKTVPGAELDEIVERFMTAFDIHPPNPNMLIKNLSGGNQQKVLLARWLATAPKLVILDEPTRGIDVGTKAQIQQTVIELARQGMSVIFISSELEEVIRLARRIVVMRDRQKIAEIPNTSDVTSSTILETIAARSEAS